MTMVFIHSLYLTPKVSLTFNLTLACNFDGSEVKRDCVAPQSFVL